MSVEASISIRIKNTKTQKLATQTEILEILINNGWKAIYPSGYVLYLPVGDKDMFDWQEEKINIPSLMKIVKKKEKTNELIGIGLIWQDSEIGGNVLLRHEKDMSEKKIYTSMSFSLGGERKMLMNEDGFEITDVNWYLQRLLPALNQEGFTVEFFKYQEHI